MKKLLAMTVCILVCFMFASCSNGIDPEPGKTAEAAPTEESTPLPATDGSTAEPVVTEGPADVPATEIPATEDPATEIPATEIPVTETPATDPPATDGEGLTDFGVTVLGDEVKSVMGVFNISKGGKYKVYGTADKDADISIIVDAPGEDVELVLDNLTILNSNLPAVRVLNARSVRLTVVGTVKLENKAVSGNADREQYSVISSLADLTVSGDYLFLNAGKANGIYADGILTIIDANLNVTAGLDGIGASAIGVQRSKIDVEAMRDGIATDDTRMIDDARRGFITFNNSEANITAVTNGINAATNLTVYSGDYTVNVPYKDEYGTGILAHGAITLYDGNITIQSPHEGIAAESDVLLDEKTLSRGSIEIYAGTVHIKTDNDCLRARYITVKQGKFELYDAKRAFSADELLISEGDFDINVVHDVASVAKSFEYAGGRMQAYISGGSTPTKHNTFKMNGGIVCLESSNPEGSFGLPSDSHYNAGTFLFLGESTVIPDAEAAVPVVRLINVSLAPGRTYAIGQPADPILSTFTVYHAAYTQLWIASDTIIMNAVNQLSRVGDAADVYAWNQANHYESVGVFG